MKKLFILFLIISAAISLKAQVEIEWQRCYGGTDYDCANAIQQTTDGGYILAGYTSSNDNNASGNNGGYDMWVVKLDLQGSIQWHKCLGGTSEDRASSIQQTTDGGYVVAGFTMSNNGDVSGNNGYKDMWVVKLDSQGNIIWQKCLGGTSHDWANSVKQTTDYGYIVAGYTESIDGDVSGNHGYYDMWVVKLDPQGNIQWQKCFGGPDREESFSIQQTTDGGYILTGYTMSYNGDVSGNNGLYDMWVVKLDLQGSIQWQKCLGGTGEDRANSIQQTTDGGYIVAGFTLSNNGDVSGNHGYYDIWVVKLDSQSNIQWQKCLGGTEYECANSIQQTADGNYIVAGCAQSNNGDVSGLHSTLYVDMWIVTLNSQGSIKWQLCLGGTVQDWAFSNLQTTDGGYIVAGYSDSNNGDVSGCHGYGDMWVVKLIEPNISGTIFLDLNENGIKDTLEQGVAGHLVRLMPGNHYTFTNNDGYYYFRGDTGITNTVKYVAQQYWVETTNNYYHYVTLDSLSQVVDTLDYAVKSRINVNDVSVYITGAPTRTNSQTHYWLTYKNWGTVTANGTIEFQYDPLLTYNTSTLTPVSHVGNTLIFAYDTLGPGTQRMLHVDFQMPGVQNLGDSLHSYAMITPLIPDTFVTNNYDTLQQVITGSYDPNDKKVMPAGYEQWGFVEHGQRLTYTIRFQNTGTDTAITVVIRDTLDTDLDIETFVVEANSHPVTWQLHNGNELFFTFQNIMLPDSNVNELESHGFIRYSISPKQGLADGTTATNTSYIFFDYNPAVVTNTTLNTFVTNIPVACPIREALKTLVFPNPSTDIVYINLPEFTRKVEVYNFSGEMVKEIIPQKSVAEINVQGLPAGVYAVRIYYSGGSVNTKFVKK